uniref:Large ribosomal subunit protein bL20c n=1 Tax=Quercus lobata TaxID=97700 RepID=A0A7N2LUB4_QUELO
MAYEKLDWTNMVPPLYNRFSKWIKVNYGNFMHGLMKENIQLNRKVLSELSMHEPYSFKALVDISRNAFPGNKNVVLPPKKEGISIVL